MVSLRITGGISNKRLSLKIKDYKKKNRRVSVYSAQNADKQKIYLTGKDVLEWCRNHKCTEESCEYMTGYCHITEYKDERCLECLEPNCRKCKYVN